MTTGLSDFQASLVARRAEVADLIAAAGAMAGRGDTDGLRDLGGALTALLAGLPSALAVQAGAQVDPIFDAAFPAPDPPAGPADIERIADVLDTPWMTEHRRAAIRAADAACGGSTSPRSLAAAVVKAPPSPARTRAAGGLLREDLGFIPDAVLLGLLATLHEAGELAEHHVLRVLETQPQFGWMVAGRTPTMEAIRVYADDRLWELTAPDRPEWPHSVPRHVPAGPRFVLRGIDMVTGRHPVDRGWHGNGLPDRMCQALLTAAEADQLGAVLASRPPADRAVALAHRYTAGDADRLLAPFGLATAAPVLDLVRRSEAGRTPADAHVPRRCDVAAVREVIDAADPEHARILLTALPGIGSAEQFAAVYGWNDTAVRKRFAHHAFAGIAAFGLLPLPPAAEDARPRAAAPPDPDAARADAILDRYLALRASAKHGATFGAQRRVSHAEAVDVAFDHLAQIAGYRDASELELDMEARIAASAPTEWSTGDYAIRLDPETADLVIARDGGRTLASVPTPIRRTDAYRAARVAQETLREQRRRMRRGLVERLVATGVPVDLPTLRRYLAVPAAAGLLTGLIWRDISGTTGMLAEGHLRTLDGTAHPFTGPVQAVHPVEQTPADLAAWQREMVRTRTVQPVKQAFREVYAPTPAEVEAGFESARFAGHIVDGRIAARLLSGRGWHIEHRNRRPLARVHGDIRAEVHAEYDHYFAEPDGGVIIGTIAFADGRAAVRLDEVTPRAFSETMRDLDLAVGVAGRGVTALDTGIEERAALLAALVADLGLANVAVDGHTARVTGQRARYRVHLGSGSIHVEPAGYLCVVPADFGAKPARNLFLPFADEDRMTSVVLSKVLLLAQDAKITDATILAQLARLTGD